MGKNSDKGQNYTIATTLGKETVFNGKMVFQDSLKIDGKYYGNIESKGFLYIEKDAVVHANITAGAVAIGGTVYGDIIASEKVEMLNSGKVYGNIKTARLKIADDVVFEGKCEMIRDAESADIFSAPTDKLKKALDSV